MEWSTRRDDRRSRSQQCLMRRSSQLTLTGVEQRSKPGHELLRHTADNDLSCGMTHRSFRQVHGKATHESQAKKRRVRVLGRNTVGHKGGVSLNM